MIIDISPRKVLLILLTMIGILLCANILGIVSTHVFGHGRVFGLIDLFDFNTETNIPTMYSSLQLILASLLLFFIGAKLRSNDEKFVSWLFLALIFLYLAVDETAQIHERIATLIHSAYEPTGLLYFAWVIPYGLALLAFVIAFSGFLFRLPRKVTHRFIASGTVYITGAIGFEMLGGRHFESNGPNNVIFAVYYTCEELLEMLGIALFIYALLAYAADRFQYLKLVIKD